MSEVSKDLRTIFFRQNPDFELEVVFFSSKKKFFADFFQNTANFFDLNFISKRKQKNQSNFFERSGGWAIAYYNRMIYALLPSVIGKKSMSRVCHACVTRMSHVCHAW